MSMSVGLSIFTWIVLIILFWIIGFRVAVVEKEIKESEHALSILGGEVISIIPYSLSDREQRNLILIKKIRPGSLYASDLIF